MLLNGVLKKSKKVRGHSSLTFKQHEKLQSKANAILYRFLKQEPPMMTGNSAVELVENNILFGYNFSAFVTFFFVLNTFLQNKNKRN